MYVLGVIVAFAALGAGVFIVFEVIDLLAVIVVDGLELSYYKHVNLAWWGVAAMVLSPIAAFIFSAPTTNDEGSR